LIRVWRLSPAKYVDRIFSGGGAYRQGGRWNSPGRAVIYMSESLALCALESLAHMVRMHMMGGFKYVWVDIPEASLAVLDPKDVPADWAAVPAPHSTKKIGDCWFDEKAFAVLEVPSTVIPVEHNFVINPSHPQFAALRVGDIHDFKFDDRLLKIEKAIGPVRA
jgi:RES domain-containing protein